MIVNANCNRFEEKSAPVSRSTPKFQELLAKAKQSRQDRLAKAKKSAAEARKLKYTITPEML
jgi:hypothetical protein